MANFAQEFLMMFRADIGQASAKIGELQGQMTGMQAKAEESRLGFVKAGAAVAGAMVVAGVAVGAVAVKMAMDFQTVTTTLVTGAGESVKNIDMIRTGLLAMASEVGTAPAELAKGLYNIESAGYHGAAALTVLRASAEGAKVGLADQAVVADALTSALNAYQLPASQAVNVTNDLIATVAAGKMHMADLAQNIGNVLAPAAAMGVSLPQVSAALATMTMQGTNAAKATTYLRQMILSMGAEKPAGVKALKDIGIAADDLRLVMKRQPDGLIQAIALVNEHLDKRFPQSAKMAVAEFAKVKAGTETADEALTNLANNGGKGYINALRDIAGGQKQMMGLLELTGPHVTVLRDNFNGITAAVNGSGGAINGWKLVEGTFQEKVDKLKAGLQAFMITIGTQLLPVLSTVADWLTAHLLPALQQLFQWFQQNANTIKGVFVSAFNVLVGVITPVVTAIGFLIQHLDVVGPLVLGVVAAFVAWKVAMGIQALMTAVTAAIFSFQLGLAGATAMEEGGTAATYALGAAMRFLMANPILIFLAAIVAVGLLIITHWNQVKQVATTVWNAVLSVVMNVWNRIKGVVMPVVNVIVAAFNVIRTVAVAVFNALVPVVTVAFNIIKTIVMVFFTIVSTEIGILISIFSVAFNIVATVVTVAFNVIKAIVTVVFSIIFQLVDGLVKFFIQLGQVGGTVFGFIASVIKPVIDFLTAVGKAIQGFVVPILNTLWGVAKTVFNWIAGVLTTIGGFIGTYIIGPIGVVIGWLSGALTTAWNALKSLVSTVLSAIGGFIGTYIVTPIQTVIGWIGGALTNAFNAVKKVAGDVFGAIGGFIDKVVGPIKAVVGFISTIAGFLGGSPTVSNVTMTSAQANAWRQANPGKALPPNVTVHAEGGHIEPGRWGIVGDKGPELEYGGKHGRTILNRAQVVGALHGGGTASGGHHFETHIAVSGLPEHIVAQVRQAVEENNHRMVEAIRRGQARPAM